MYRRTVRVRKGHDLERIAHGFTDEDLADLKPKKVFNDKWIIIKKMEKRGAAHCYQVCDKAIKMFGVLYLEIGRDNVTSIANQVEFSLQQFSLGYSHHFTNIIDTDIINNHVFYMVVRIRPGPTLEQLINCLKDEKASATTAAFLAIDIFAVFELLIASGHVLRNFDTKQWKLDVKTRQFYLADTTDVTVSSDKRHRSIEEIHINNAETINLHWTSNDLTYAPRAFIIYGPAHRMSELDMLEMIIYFLFDMTRGKLPWKNSKCQQRTLELKQEFMENLPQDGVEKFEEEVDKWFNTALQNLVEHVKVAKIAQDRLEKLPVRGGAWCPKGPRAGALMTTVNYRRIVEDFTKIVLKGKPEWSIYWRDVMLDWDREIEYTPENIKLIKAYEKRQKALELADEWQRLMATRSHYEVMKEHGEAEQVKNQIAIEKYLNGEQDEEEMREKLEQEAKVKHRKYVRIQRMKIAKEEELDDGYDWALQPKIEKKEEIDDGYEKMDTDRAARLERRRQRLLEQESEMIPKREVKDEEPDDYDYDHHFETKDIKKFDLDLVKMEPLDDEFDQEEDTKMDFFVSKKEEPEEYSELMEQENVKKEFDVKMEEPDDYEYDMF